MAPALKKSQLYWLCQVFGWSFYIIVNSIFFGLSREPGAGEYLVYFLMLPAGIAISHAYRALILRLDILSRPIPMQLVYIVVFSFVKGIVFFLAILLLSKISGLQLSGMSAVFVFESIINFTSIFWLWNVIYFGFQYFQNYKLSEINALRYLAASRQSELDNLKAQLNPHFIFNCLNSIRALVDENPLKAKKAVTTLSTILRNTLLIGKNKEIPLREEVSLVKDYLHLEKIRYEERLEYSFNITESLENCMIPPFILQAQVENAVKHGISKLSGNGIISIKAEHIGSGLQLMVSNTGRLNNSKPLTGVGLRNSAQRLELLYGPQSLITMHENNGRVEVRIFIPAEKITMLEESSNELITQANESDHY
jgi:two-component system LytT family sensor kinase